MAQLFSDRDLARTVGKAHLKSQPDNTGVADVALRLVGNPDQHARLTRADDRTLRRFLHLCRQRDFKSGRTVFIDGWVLSETEANLCAVVALLPSSQRGNGALAGLYV